MSFKKTLAYILVEAALGLGLVGGAEADLIIEPPNQAATLQQIVSPTEFYHEFNSGDGHRGTQYVEDVIFNYISLNVDADLTWQETFNPYHVGYTLNLPRTQTLFPGTNTIYTSFDFAGHTAGANVYGYIEVNAIPEPATLGLLTLGGLAMLVTKHSRKNQR